VGFHTFAELAKQFFGAAMAMVKEISQHPPHRKAIRDVPYPSERKLIFDGVDEQRAMLPGCLLLPLLNAMALSPIPERTLDLAVTKALIPVKVLDERDPRDANWR
jgi:hypothetical protein